MKSISRHASLVICGHGSTNAGWNALFEDLVQRIRENHQITDAFPAGISVAFLEHATPSLEEAAQDLVKGNADRVLVLPVFLSASSHLSEDLPQVIASLLARGIPVQTVQGPALPQILGQNALRRVKERCRETQSPGVVLTYYGSHRYAEKWDELINEVGEILSEGGFPNWEAAPIGHVVESSPIPTRDAILKILEHNEKAVVVPLLVSISDYQTKIIPQAINDLGEKERQRVIYHPDAILPDEALARWLIEIALEARID